MKTCAIDQCPDPAESQGYCKLHYSRKINKGVAYDTVRYCLGCGVDTRKTFWFCETCKDKYTTAEKDKLRKRKHYLDNPERYKERNRNKTPEFHRKYNMKKKYGISVIEFEQLKKACKNTCCICNKVFDDNAIGTKRLYIDHEHENGVIRGLLCHNCNFGLGYFKDNANSLANAIKYLEKEELWWKKEI